MAALPLAVAACQTWQVLALYNFVDTHATPEAFGVPVARLLEAASAARRLGAPEVLVVSAGSDTWQDNEPAVFDALLHGTPQRFVDGRTTAVMPEGDAALLLWPGDFPVNDLYHEWGREQLQTEISLRQGEGTVYVTQRGGALPVPRPPSARLRPASARRSSRARTSQSDSARAGGPDCGPSSRLRLGALEHLLSPIGCPQPGRSCLHTSRRRLDRLGTFHVKL